MSMSSNSFSSKKQPVMVAQQTTVAVPRFVFSALTSKFQFLVSARRRPRRPTLATSDGIFDAPHGALTKLPAETRATVSAVSPKWGVGLINEKTLALYVPHDQDVLGVSKKKFVDLLDFAEEKLEMERVLAVFEKARVVPTEGFARTLRYVGFRPYAIDEHPAQLPADKYFIMSYKV